METVNVQIKLTPGKPPRPATHKVMLPKPTPEQRAQGLLHRPLEPYEVVALPVELAEEWLENLPFELELTRKPVTRPLYFNDVRERDMSSADYKEQIGGRADKIKEKVAAERERQAKALAEQKANEPESTAPVDVSEATMAAVVARLESLGFEIKKKDPDEPIPENNAAIDGDVIVDEELENYVPQNNTTTKKELDDIVEKERKAAGDKADEVEAVTLVRDSVETEETETAPEVPEPRRRRRRARTAE